MNNQTIVDMIGFGAIAVDDLFFLKNYPQPDSKIEVKKHVRFGGGLAGTALVAAARLGINTSYFGALGENELSNYTRAEFAKENVSTSLCLNMKGAKPIHSTIIVDQSTGGRTILYNMDGFQSPPVDAITSDKLSGCKLIFIDTYILDIIPHVLSLANSLSIPVLADIESEKITGVGNSLAQIDHLILNKRVAADIVKEQTPQNILSALESSDRICSVITDGKQGCWFREKGKPVYHMPAFKVDTVDTTGCGDVFHGAYAAALIRGEDILNAIMQASAAAAIKATQPGGRKGIPAIAKLRAFLTQNREIRPRKITL